nr:mechanosensitive ion channel domain-containing protein [Legionella nagasakiensis]
MPKRPCWLQVVCFIIFCFSFSPLAAALTAHAKSYENNNRLIEFLVQEKTGLTIANNELQQSSPPHDYENYLERKRQNAALLTLNHGKIANLELFLANQRKQQEQLMQRLKKLQQSPPGKSGEMIVQEQISKLNTLNDVNKKIIELITDNLELAHRYEKDLQTERHQLDLWKADFDKKQQLNALNKKIRSLEEKLEALYQKGIYLQQEKKTDVNFNASFNDEARLLLNNQTINLIQNEVSGLELRKRLIKAENQWLKHQDVKSIQLVIETYKAALEQLNEMKQSLKNMVDLLDSEQSLLIDKPLRQYYLRLQSAIQTRLQAVSEQQETLQVILEKRQQLLKKQLSARQSLVEYHLDSWPSIVKQFIQIPGKFYNYLKRLVMKVKDNYIWQDALPVAIYWASLILILFAAIGLNRLLRAVIQDKERSRLSAHLYDGVLVLLQRNMPHLTLMTMVIVTFFLHHVPLVNYRLLVNLLLVWLAYRNLILIARLMLLERISDASGKDVRLYYRLKWLLLAGGWSTALMVFSHQLPLSSLLQDIFNRLFMLFLLALSVVLWKSKDIIPYLLRPFLKTRKRYVRNAIALLVSLVPLTLFTTALIGLVGYINLAWTMSRYQVYLLLVITGYVLIRGLLFDALELLSEWMISALRNGWLWIEVLLKPLDKILRALLLVLSIVLLFQLFGWYSDSWVMVNLQEFARYPFVNISGVYITFLSTVEFLVLLFIFIWMAKWTREFCYRWLYRNARDAGIRNSLSVFTQYAVVLIGGFITLRVLGLDFSGMSMVLGGLAVGMGFGLRDFASNIIGGIMLLIERPVREGDLITLGEYEGRVAHIGIRSMRVSSWDNMEVLIPNAETFNKPFTNWTHQDSVVRTVIPIKVSRSDEPIMIQQLILDVLAIIPEILDEPPPQVFLKQIDDALIEFEVRYFINVQLHTRFEIRSKVLFAITAQFKAAGVKPPIPPLSIELTEVECNHAAQKSIKE